MPSTQNVDSEEIAKFEQLASRWWDPESEFNPLHAINPLRLNFIDQRIGLAKKKVLDVGCGGGILSESMALRGAIITGIDMGDAPLSVARLHSTESNVEVNYRKITVEELAEEMPSEFDAITCLEMLEHVPDPASVVQACSKLLKPNGDIFFATLNRTTKSWLFAIIAAEYILKILPKGTHKHSKFIKPHELSRWMRQNNIKLREISGLTYNPLTKVYRLNKTDTDVNYILHGKLQT
ncbi:MAG: bifunctional 2-polyprenyl-6-hydroxyphenol methylase/3-demethylubiquinol 3-O-methyltransferase UbiG [Candidatus Endonucleobacter bathymodioli]|uniref:Ubiquinone biosynthesis O-methyltransferase n=1 Tax=Candidatus Endonucleibacter bathymodioli TaxID=539814 RepID=A0AA90NXT7_9GAMM|nr:bifunctional 2-polyprenyl-6-hydroxyphenol methylase/3-demethylubiquinol 3-O-methyltransferase UbiG [Candidatus Endonucleobacter bathymodioli]